MKGMLKKINRLFFPEPELPDKIANLMLIGKRALRNAEKDPKVRVDKEAMFLEKKPTLPNKADFAVSISGAVMLYEMNWPGNRKLKKMVDYEFYTPYHLESRETGHKLQMLERLMDGISIPLSLGLAIDNAVHFGALDKRQGAILGAEIPIYVKNNFEAHRNYFNDPDYFWRQYWNYLYHYFDKRYL